MTDPIADFLTRLRNALRVHKSQVVVPYSRLKSQIADILAREGLIERVEREARGQGELRVYLKYDPTGRSLIRDLQRVSKPGRRAYVGRTEIPRPQDGYGIAILSTSHGVMTNREAQKLGVGGEVLCEVS